MSIPGPAIVQIEGCEPTSHHLIIPDQIMKEKVRKNSHDEKTLIEIESDVAVLKFER